MADLPLIKTSDITLASSLLCIGFDVMGIDNRNPRRAVFFFKKTPKLMQKIDAYWNKELKVSPLDLSHSRKEIMSRIFGDKSIEKRQSSQS